MTQVVEYSGISLVVGFDFQVDFGRDWGRKPFPGAYGTIRFQNGSMSLLRDADPKPFEPEISEGCINARRSNRRYLRVESSFEN